MGHGDPRHLTEGLIDLDVSLTGFSPAEIAAAKANGIAAPDPLPHPDDIIIDDTTGPRFIGPAADTELTKGAETIRYRDLMILRDAFDGTPLTKPGSNDAGGLGGGCSRDVG